MAQAGIRSGFTLVEMAVVLVVISLLIMTVLPNLSSLRNNAQRGATQSNLQALMQSTAAFVQANGCLPCPTPATLGNTAGLGYVRGDSSGAPLPCNGCPTAEGLVPYASLGLPAATAHDGWGHWITMRVDPALTAAALNSIVPPTKTCSCSSPVNNVCTASSSACSCAAPVNNVCAASPANISMQGLCAAGLSSSGRISVINAGAGTQKAAVIFVSHGANGFGAYIYTIPATFSNGSRIPFPNNVTPQISDCQSNAYERCNASGGTQFVSASSVLSDSSPPAYDDMMIFADRNTLVSQLGNGSCQTVW